MASETYMMFLKTVSPLLISAVIGALMVCWYYFFAPKRFRMVLLFMLPGVLVVALSIVGTGIIYWRGQQLAKEFEDGVRSQILAKNDELIADLMAGRYLEVSQKLDLIRRSSQLLDIAVFTSDGQLVAKVPNTTDSLSGNDFKLDLVRTDLDGSPVKWGSLSYGPDFRAMTEWAESERGRWTMIAVIVLVALIVFSLAHSWLIERQIYGLLRVLRDLRLKVVETKDVDELACSLMNHDPYSGQLMEEAGLKNSLAVIGKHIADLNNKTIELEVEARIGRMITQVVHDIRSPLSLVKIVAESSDGISPEKASMLKMGYDRATKITSDLLGKFRDGEKRDHPTIARHLVAIAIERVLSEKSAIHERKGVSIEFTCSPEAKTSFVEVELKELERAVSNIVENGIEAVKGRLPRLHVDCRILEQEDKSFHLSIKDNGIGIPADLLKRIGTKGITFGKERGNGLGVFHAKSLVESMGGTFEIDSIMGAGTTINMFLPVSEVPLWFFSPMKLSKLSYVVVDDDPAVHELCRRHFGNVIVECYSDTNLIDSSHLLNEKVGFLVDHDIRGSNMSGLEFIEKNELKNRAILMTSDFDQGDVQEGALSAGVSILPKFLILQVSSGDNSISVSLEKFDIALVDDDELVRMCWQLRARDLGKRIAVFRSPQEFNNANVSLDTPTFVDLHLKDGGSGLDFARRLHQLGYQNISLSTGEVDVKDVPSFVRSVNGKDFPALE